MPFGQCQTRFEWRVSARRGWTHLCECPAAGAGSSSRQKLSSPVGSFKNGSQQIRRRETRVRCVCGGSTSRRYRPQNDSAFIVVDICCSLDWCVLRELRRDHRGQATGSCSDCLAIRRDLGFLQEFSACGENCRVLSSPRFAGRGTFRLWFEEPALDTKYWKVATKEALTCVLFYF